jgi:hypothetical protein
MTKEDVIRSIKQQLDLHISILRDDMDVWETEIEIDLVHHIKNKLKEENNG